jgi:NDP-sugar pyrophosphorylase family protein
MFKKGIILSGGEGLRMLPITEYIPKALVKKNNKELINHNIDLFRDNNITQIVVTYNYLSEILFTKINKKTDVFLNTTNKDNSYFIFNTIISEINSPFVLVPCDIIFDINFEELYNDYISQGEPPIMIVGVNPIEGIDGDYIHHVNNNIKSLNRDKKEIFYCSGIQVINPKKINDLIKKCDNFYGVWDSLIKINKLKLSNIHPIKWLAFDKIEHLENG